MCYFSKMKWTLTKTIITEWSFSYPNKSVCQKYVDPVRKENQPKKRYTPFLQEILWLFPALHLHRMTCCYKNCYLSSVQARNARLCQSTSVEKIFIRTNPLAKWLNTCLSTRTWIQHWTVTVVQSIRYMYLEIILTIDVLKEHVLCMFINGGIVFHFPLVTAWYQICPLIG